MTALATLASLAGGVGLGVGSALLPLINAEAYVLLISARHPAHVLLGLTVLGVAIGQTVGKAILFESGRRARLPARLRRRGEDRPGRRLSRERVATLLQQPRTGVPIVLAAATVGLPPLAVVSVLAGASGQRRATFAVVCLVGRLVRFAVLATPLTLK